MSFLSPVPSKDPSEQLDDLVIQLNEKVSQDGFY